MNDDPSTYDAPATFGQQVAVRSVDPALGRRIDSAGVPAPTKPRTLVYSGEPSEPRPSVALAVLGELLNDAEHAVHRQPGSKAEIARSARIFALREARDAVAAAEAQR